MTSVQISRRALLAGLATFPLSACGEIPDLVIAPDAASIGTAEEVFLATNRVFEDGRFQSFRQDALAYSRFTVEIPPDRDIGSVRPARTRRNGPNLQTEFAASEGYHLNTSARFGADLSAEARRRSTNEVMIFIHGFANTIGSGIYRTAQIRHDFEVPSVAVHYAWPSASNYLGYVYDRDSALFARDGLEELITTITDTGLNVLLVAHSLGGGLVMEVLRQLRIGDREDILNQINGVFLFSPDVDVDVFRSQATRIGTLPQPFVIFTSQRDQALLFSARITGQRERVGNLASADEVSAFNVTMIDVSAFEDDIGDPFHHFAGANSPSAVRILRGLSQVSMSLDENAGLTAEAVPGTVVTVENATMILLDQVE